jgi:uncharacterized membrane protein
MKQLIKVLVLSVVIFFSTSLCVQAEVISTFVADYKIEADGTVLVKETITYDFAELERRGIFRTLLFSHPQKATAWYKSRSVLINVLSVSKNGSPEPFLVTENKNDLEIKIGNPDLTISGLQTYEINYELIGALSSGPSGAEFYWNVTGNDWPIVIEEAVAKVSSSQINIFKGNNACYQGLSGAKTACLEADTRDGQIIFRAENLAVGEGLTIATELDPALVSVVSFEKNSYLPFGFVAGLLWLLYFAYKVYRYRVESRIDRPVIAQYEPYPNYLPMYTGVIYDGQLDSRDVTAGILYLAEQGFIKIKRTEKKVLLFINTTDYEITLLKPVSDMSTEFLKTLSGLLFSTSATLPQTVMLSSLAANRVKNSALILKLRSSLTLDLKAGGITTNTLPPWSKSKTILVIFLVTFFGLFLLVENGIMLVVVVAITTLIIGVFALVDRKTAKGYEIVNHLEGFKLFLSVTDKERFNFHNAPEKSPELFMAYLPYAIALGVEEKWAKVFEDITIPQPDWYDGGNIGAFSASALTSDIGAFSASFSASSGTSGSSGGGSSSGGGGGGGGGSW